MIKLKKHEEREPKKGGNDAEMPVTKNDEIMKRNKEYKKVTKRGEEHRVY